MPDGSFVPVKRERVERAIEVLMSLLDEMDGNDDLEAEHDGREPDDEDVEHDGAEPEQAF